MNPLNPIGKIKHQLAQLLTFGLSTYLTLQLHKPIKFPFLATSMQHFSVGSIPNVPPVFMVQFPIFHHVWWQNSPMLVKSSVSRKCLMDKSCLIIIYCFFIIDSHIYIYNNTNKYIYILFYYYTYIYIIKCIVLYIYY